MTDLVDVVMGALEEAEDATRSLRDRVLLLQRKADALDSIAMALRTSEVDSLMMSTPKELVDWLKMMCSVY